NCCLSGSHVRNAPPCLLHLKQDNKGRSMQDTVSNLQAASMLETMMLTRAAEEALVALQVAGQAAGTCTSVGQEASSTGVISALSPQDRILTNHRSAGHLLARGADPGRLFAEVLGRRDG